MFRRFVFAYRRVGRCAARHILRTSISQLYLKLRVGISHYRIIIGIPLATPNTTTMHSDRHIAAFRRAVQARDGEHCRATVRETEKKKLKGYRVVSVAYPALPTVGRSIPRTSEPCFNFALSRRRPMKADKAPSREIRAASRASA